MIKKQHLHALRDVYRAMTDGERKWLAGGDDDHDADEEDGHGNTEDYQHEEVEVHLKHRRWIQQLTDNKYGVFDNMHFKNNSTGISMLLR